MGKDVLEHWPQAHPEQGGLTPSPSPGTAGSDGAVHAWVTAVQEENIRTFFFSISSFFHVGCALQSKQYKNTLILWVHAQQIFTAGARSKKCGDR